MRRARCCNQSIFKCFGDMEEEFRLPDSPNDKAHIIAELAVRKAKRKNAASFV